MDYRAHVDALTAAWNTAIDHSAPTDPREVAQTAATHHTQALENELEIWARRVSRLCSRKESGCGRERPPIRSLRCRGASRRESDRSRTPVTDRSTDPNGGSQAEVAWGVRERVRAICASGRTPFQRRVSERRSRMEHRRNARLWSGKWSRCTSSPSLVSPSRL